MSCENTYSNGVCKGKLRQGCDLNYKNSRGDGYGCEGAGYSYGSGNGYGNSVFCGDSNGNGYGYGNRFRLYQTALLTEGLCVEASE